MKLLKMLLLCRTCGLPFYSKFQVAACPACIRRQFELMEALTNE